MPGWRRVRPTFGPDVAPEVKPDAPPLPDGAGTCGDSRDCPNSQVCTMGRCMECTADYMCQLDAVHGARTICLNSRCVIGNCRDDSAGCTGGQICGASESHTCGRCTSDAHCNNDPRYRGFFCIDGACKMGDCRTSDQCTGLREGLLCNAQMPNQCGTCANDGQCKQEERYRQRICHTAAGQPETGRCVSDACPTNGQACAANTADFCCGNRCIPGNCCDDGQCMAGQACVANTCTTCDAVAGNQYFVDPVNGSDRAGTGSGKSGGAALARCAFRTVTQALSAIPQNAAAGTTITIVGATGSVTDLYVGTPTGGVPTDTLPIAIRANIKVTTAGGPIRLRLGAGQVGFRLQGNAAALAPDPRFVLEIDGQNHLSGSGVTAAGGNVTLEHVLIHETGDHGVRVTDGVAAIGGGVIVRSAGTDVEPRSGLEVTAGVARITVPAGTAQTLLEANTGPGVTVGPLAEFDATGAATTSPVNGTGTIVVRSNEGRGHFGAGVAIEQAGSSTRVHDLRGIVVWAHTQGPGLLIRGGARVKLRNSVLLANKTNGVLVSPGTDPAASNDLSRIDLGVAGDFGRNYLQVAATGNNSPNGGAAVCVERVMSNQTLTVRARGNFFALKDCTVANAGPIRSGTDCSVSGDVAIAPGNLVNVDVTNCTRP